MMMVLASSGGLAGDIGEFVDREVSEIVQGMNTTVSQFANQVSGVRPSRSRKSWDTASTFSSWAISIVNSASFARYVIH